MEDIVKLLPDIIANQIAAGEVVQRPSSVVKELMENAVDAGANRVQLIVKDAGKTWIQVIDNGCGMTDTDARMSFERHATSKIRKPEDLYHIRTMGFRGEALASIAAVSQVEMRTRMELNKVGTQLIIEAGIFISQDPTAANPGTSITVKNLFYNVPARRNFLKSNAAETRHIIDEFQRVALAHPNISFTFHHNGAELFHLKEGNLRQRVVAMFGHPYNERLVPIEEKTTVLTIYGFIGKPETAKKMRGEQFLFVNNRFIKSHYLHHAIVTAYDEMIPSDAHPLYTIFLDIDPARIDVNVHPTKQEIKFDDEKIIYTFVHTAVKHSLGKYSVSPTLDFDQETAFSNMNQALQAAPKTISSETLAPSSYTDARLPDKSSASPTYWKSLYEEAKQNKTTVYTIPSKWEQEDRVLFNQEEQHQDGQIAFQIHNQYILSQIKSGYIIADQQAAHERVLFDQYLKYLSGQKISTQQQLFPVQITLNQSDALLLADVMDELKQLGFDIHPFGGTTYVIHGAPSEVLTGQEQEALEKILDAYKQSQELKHNRREAVARAFAKLNCIKHGKSLSEKECRFLLDELFACENPYYTPDGSPTFITYSIRDLEKQFSGKS